MVRLLIPLIAIFFIWLLFFSSFTKRIRIVLSIGVLLLSAAALWFDMNSRAVSTGVVELSQLSNCGVKSQFSYRSNYNIDLCLRNTATEGTVRKIEVRFDAASCVERNCVDLQSRVEIIHLNLPPDEQLIHTENLAFDLVPENTPNVLWTAEVLKIWAVK